MVIYTEDKFAKVSAYELVSWIGRQPPGLSKLNTTER